VRAPQRRHKFKVEVHHGRRVLPTEEGNALLRTVSAAMRDRHERDLAIRALSRRPRGEDAANVRFAMRSIEHRIVRGLWVLELALPIDGPKRAARHGIDYLNERADVNARYTDAAGGKWESSPPRPAIPSNREIESAKEAVGWIERLDEAQARLLHVAALSKRGDRERRVGWERVRSRLPEVRDTPMRTLQDRYDQALRTLVAELTIDRIAK
jgi:hypothetical protein